MFSANTVGTVSSFAGASTPVETGSLLSLIVHFGPLLLEFVDASATAGFAIRA